MSRPAAWCMSLIVWCLFGIAWAGERKGTR